MTTETNDLRHFILTFIGGDMDGRVLDGRSPNKRERAVVEMFLGASSRGQVGYETKSLISYQTFLEERTLNTTDQDAVQDATTANLHTYKAIDREVKDGVCHLRVESTMQSIFADRRETPVNHLKSDTHRV